METGQMNMIQLPIEATLLPTVTGSSQSQSTQAGEQDSSAFAAILGDMTSQAPAQPTVVAVAVPAELLSQVGATVETMPLVVMEMKPEISLTLVTTSALQISEKVSAEAASSEQPAKDVELKQPEDLMPQEVVMSAAGSQIVLAPQMVGRMPESGQNIDVQVVTVTNDELPVARTAAPIASEMALRQSMEASSGSAATASVTPSPALPQEAQRHVETVAAQVVAQTPATPQARVAPEAPAILQTQTVPQAPPAQQSQVVPKTPASETQTASAIPEAPAPSVPSGPVGSAIPAAKATTPDVPKIQLRQVMEAYSRPFSAASEVPKAAERLAEQRSDEAVVAQAGPVSLQVVTPVEIPSGQQLDAAPAAHTDAAARIVVVPATQELGVQKPATTPLQLETAIPEEPYAVPSELPVKHAIETGAIPARAVIKMTDGRAGVQDEQLQQQAPVAADVKTADSAENVIAKAVKAVAGATTGEDCLSGDKSTSDQAMNGQVHQVSQQRIKTETVAAAPVATAGTSGVAEQVVKQVSDHCARHEIKTGSEQIVLRLSPENLGELKVNLRMENQRLTVEIVTENRMVRDAILQNSDTLKESLAKQNIKMDSFSVSSGSNSNDSLAGRNGRNQNEWQELSRNRQANQWLQGGYNLPKDFIPEKLAYNQQAEYGMLNVHY
ncbi:MAG: flagellar hook-length control protein FliK [Deltaproteobacteria bacterium]